MTGDRIEYTELDWRWAILLGAAVREGLIEAVADRERHTAEEYERWLLDAGYGAIEFELVDGRSSHQIFARRAG